MLDYRLRPMGDKTWLDQVPKRAPVFRMDWPAMLDNLAAEVEKLGGYDVTLELDAPAESLTARGSVKRGAIVWSTAAVVTFDTDEHGEMVLRCDRYRLAEWGARSTLAAGWQSNVHAIGLHLEGLRALERHGVARGEQYDAYKALPSGSPMAVAAMSAEAAIQRLVEAAQHTAPWPFLPAEQKRVVKLARRRTHPDQGGDPQAWAEVDQAVLTLVTAGVLPAGT